MPGARAVNESLKQRLVGALILLALGVIFWPIIFVEPARDGAGGERVIPPGPGVSVAPLAPPDRGELRESPPIALHDAAGRGGSGDGTDSGAGSGALEDSLAAADTEAPEATAETAPPPPQALRLDGDGVPVAWVLQVASVSTEDKARALRDRLLAMDHKAYVDTVTSDGRRLYRVFIGPKFDRRSLDRLRERIDAEFAVTSMVRRYVP